ncbi:MAG: hypothetical protein ACREK2_00525 [Gemmatimonadota bacterium]
MGKWDRLRALMRPPQGTLRYVCLLLALGCRGAGPPQGDEGSPMGADTASATRPSNGEPTSVEIVDVDLRLFEGATVHVTRLAGIATSVRSGEPVALDDNRAYRIDVTGAETWIGWPDLSAILNEYTFAFDEAPVGDLEISREEDEDQRDQVELKGDLENVLGLRFEIEGRPEVTPDGRIRIRTTSVQALDIPVGGLMHALGLDAADLMGNLEERGIAFDGDDLILDASRAFPPPRMSGRVAAVRVEEGGLAITLGDPGAAPRTGRVNHLWFQGGTIRIGRMTQTDADLRIVDQDPSDAFDFFSERMTRQLAAGYAKLRLDGGLTMFVPDYDDIR